MVLAPLELDVKDDGSIEILDSEVSERYAVYQGGTLRFYNAAIGDLNHILFYNINKIDSICEGERGRAIITLTDGTQQIHKAKYGNDSRDETVNLARIDYGHPSIKALKYFVYKNWPDIDHHIYYDEVNDKICVDLEIVGGHGYDFLQGLQDNPVLTRMREVLEQEEMEYTYNGQTKIKQLKVNKSDLLDVLRLIGSEHTKNLFYEHIRRTPWDGVDRIKDFLYESGCRALNLSEEDQEIYLKNILKSFLLATIERNVEESYDSIQMVLVLIGGQGAGKSSLVSRLGMGFYNPTTASLRHPKEFHESIQGSILVELQEGVQFAEDSPESIKALIDQTTLFFRKSYAPETSKRKVPYSLIVTTNNSLLLTDTTGNRRFFPVFVNARDVLTPAWQRDDEYILQLWAQALALYRVGARWRDELYEDGSCNVLKRIYLSVQSDATDDIGAGEIISQYLDTSYGKIGDKVNHYQIRSHLESNGFYGQSLKDALKIFMKSPYAFGFSEAKKVNKYISDLSQYRYVKEYHRITPPIVRVEV